MRIMELYKVRNGSVCVHSGQKRLPGHAWDHPTGFKDSGIVFRKDADSYQTTIDGKVVIFGMYDLVHIYTDYLKEIRNERSN